MERKTNKRTNKNKRRQSRGMPALDQRGERKPGPGNGSLANPIVVVRSIPLFGLRTRRRLQYFEAVSTNGTASAVYSQVYSVNGCFDPNITGTGHQPMGFDQVMVFYNHYTVRNARIRCVFQNTGTVDTHVAISVSGSTTSITDYQQLVENGNIVYTILTPSGIAGSVVALMKSCNCANFQGIDDVMDDPDMRGDISANPSEQQYFHLSFWNAVNATVPSVLLDTFIEYDVIFHEPKKGTLS